MGRVATIPTSVLPDGVELQDLAAVADFIAGHDGELRLLAANGETVVVPPHIIEVMSRLATVLGRGDGILVSAVARELSTTETAKLLGMSRPTLVRLLDEGALPSHRVRSHRRVKLEDALEFRRRQFDERRRAYREFMIEADALGFTDD